jgi:ribonuclease HI
MSDKLFHVTIYTDGGCINNPGPGGYCAVLKYGETRKVISEGFRKTTNNRMEIMAAIAGLKALNSKCSVKLYSDSQYLVNSMTKGWAKKWRANGWMRNKSEPALNPDLWNELLCLCENHKVEFLWIKGHAGHPDNEFCDKQSRKVILKNNLKIDYVYEK